MVVKSKVAFEYVKDLENIFAILRSTSYGSMLLNVHLGLDRENSWAIW